MALGAPMQKCNDTRTIWPYSRMMWQNLEQSLCNSLLTMSIMTSECYSHGNFDGVGIVVTVTPSLVEVKRIAKKQVLLRTSFRFGALTYSALPHSIHENNPNFSELSAIEVFNLTK